MKLMVSQYHLMARGMYPLCQSAYVLIGSRTFEFSKFEFIQIASSM